MFKVVFVSLYFISFFISFQLSFALADSKSECLKSYYSRRTITGSNSVPIEKRVLYGVQGTGNGHITRAKQMAPALRKKGYKIQFVISARNENDLPEDARKIFSEDADIIFYKGVSFQIGSGRTNWTEILKNTDKMSVLKNVVRLKNPLHSIERITSDGEVNWPKTIAKADKKRLLSDFGEMLSEISNYSLVISDFEPVTAWAAKMRNLNLKKNEILQKIKSKLTGSSAQALEKVSPIEAPVPLIGVAHQYSLYFEGVPGADKIPKAGLYAMAPIDADKRIGFHYDPFDKDGYFDKPILPPLIDTPERPQNRDNTKITVYLPFEDRESVIKMLAPYSQYTFKVYTKNKFNASGSLLPLPESGHEHIIFERESSKNYLADASTSLAVIANAGFGATSEAIYYGAHLLAKPLTGQDEQLANVIALEELNLGSWLHKIDPAPLGEWLQKIQDIGIAPQRNYINVADFIVDNLEVLTSKDEEKKMKIIENLWNEIRQ